MERQALAAVITVSDSVSQGDRTDGSGDLAQELLEAAGYPVSSRTVVADEAPAITAAIQEAALGCALVVTTGGTGFGPRDVTPEATRVVLSREAPGLAELMRAAGLAHTPMAALSRGVAGTVGDAVVLNLPGSPTGVREGLEAVLPVLPHAVELAAGVRGPHPTGHAPASIPTATTGSGSPGPRRWVDVKAIKLTGDPPCAVGNAMTIEPGGAVHGTLGCAEFDAEAVAAAGEVDVAGVPATRILPHEHGTVEIYLEPHHVADRVLVVSATDVARALRAFLRSTERDVVMVESRTDRLEPSDRPWIGSLDQDPLDDTTAVVFTDHDAPGVTEMLARLLRSSVRFIGVMGSRRHVAHYVQELRHLGFEDEQLARIRSPLGLDIGGREPSTIALSIAAGVVADANERDGGWLDRT